MSKDRTEARLRQNDEFMGMTAWLDQNGFAWSVQKMSRSTKHPALMITPAGGVEALRFTIAGTPRGSGNPAQAIAKMKRFLRENRVLA